MSVLKMAQKAVPLAKVKKNKIKKRKLAVFLWFSNYLCFCNIVTNPSLIPWRDLTDFTVGRAQNTIFKKDMQEIKFWRVLVFLSSVKVQD